MAQQEFYLEHPNGIELLKHVKNLSVGPDAAARREKEVRPADRANTGLLYTVSLYLEKRINLHKLNVTN